MWSQKVELTLVCFTHHSSTKLSPPIFYILFQQNLLHYPLLHHQQHHHLLLNPIHPPFGPYPNHRFLIALLHLPTTPRLHLFPQTHPLNLHHLLTAMKKLWRWRWRWMMMTRRSPQLLEQRTTAGGWALPAQRSGSSEFNVINILHLHCESLNFFFFFWQIFESNSLGKGQKRKAGQMNKTITIGSSPIIYTQAAVCTGNHTTSVA